MPKLLQINTVVNRGSTGRICEEIGLMAQSKGWESWIAYGKRNPVSRNHLIRIQGKWGFMWHVMLSRVFGMHGYGSYFATKRLVRKIKELNPDVIHLHNLHGYYLHIPTLFEYLATYGKPVVWTLHDCWAFTGHCTHFVKAKCDKWKTGCERCPLYKEYPNSWIVDLSKQNWNLKKELFTQIPNLHIIPVSEWLGGLLRESFLKDKNIQVITNGIDLNVFRPAQFIGEKRRFRVLGVASVWTETKGLGDFVKLRELLDDSVEIVLVGLQDEQTRMLPKGIIGIKRTSSMLELVNLYSESDVFVNLTYADTFPTVNIEALACGTPVVTYLTGGSPEIIDEQTGVTIEQGNVCAIAQTITQIQNGIICFDNESCRRRALGHFDKSSKFQNYINLYNKVIEGGGGKTLIFSVASTWSNDKGLADYKKLSKLLEPEYRIVMIGLTTKQCKDLPANITGITRTESKEDLSVLYSMADVVTSLSYGESFGLTIIEAAACGTPVVAYDNTGQTELVRDIGGISVPTGDIDGVFRAIKEARKRKTNRRLLQMKYEVSDRYKEYVSLYEDLIKG